MIFLALAKLGNLVTIAARRDAAPLTPMILGRVVEIEDALGIAAAPHQVEVRPREQVGRGLGKRIGDDDVHSRL